MSWQLLFLTRSLRMFAFGSTGVLLAAYLREVGLSDPAIGLLLMLALLGDAAISLAITASAERLGKWNMQLAGCALLLAACLVLASPRATGFWVLTLAATIGVVSPSGNEVGPFMALEQSMLAELLPPSRRTTVFSWYNLAGYGATALGAAQAGLLADHLRSRWGYSFASACRAVFLEGAGAALALSAAAALGRARATPRQPSRAARGGAGPGAEQREPLLPGRSGHADETAEAGRPAACQPLSPAAPALAGGAGVLSGRSRRVLVQLSTLFSVDAFAGSLVTGTLLAYYFKSTYQVSPTFMGSMLLGCNVIAGLSSLVSGHIAAAIGLVRTMVFTHAPSNVLTMLIPLMPNAWTAVGVLFARHGFSISQMDVAPRQSLIAGVVAPHERTFVMGITNVVRSLACSLGPLLTGLLAARGLWAWAFYLCGGLKLAYDLALLWSARSIEMHLVREQGPGDSAGPAAAAAGGRGGGAGGAAAPAGGVGEAADA